MNDNEDPSKIPTVPGIYIDKDDDWLEKAWTSVPNELIRHPEIEWDARAAYAWLASHQVMRFRVTAQMLADAGPRGRNHAYAMIRELEKWGWVTRHRLRNPATGRTDIQVYKLHREPVAEEARTFKPSRAVPEAPTKFITERIEEDARAAQKSTSEPVTERGVTERGVSPRPETARSGPLTCAGSSLSLEDDPLLTEGEEHTAALAREAAAPPCEPGSPVEGHPFFDPKEHSEGNDQMKLDAQAGQSVSRELQRDRQRKGSFRELAKDPCVKESFPIVARFEQRTTPLTAYGQRKWRAEVSKMLGLGHEIVDIETGMDDCLLDGGTWAWLESKTRAAAARRKLPRKSKAEAKLQQQLEDSAARYGSNPAEVLAQLYPNLYGADQGAGQPPQPALEA